MSQSEKRRLARAAAGMLSDDEKTVIEQRILAYIGEMGGGLRDIAIGNELDALLKWADQVNQGKAAFEALSIDADLKSALTPIFNLPPDLVGIIAIWQGIKDRLPK